MEEEYSTDGIICPYCKELVETEPEVIYNEDRTEYKCSDCDKEFSVSPYVQWSWTTRPMEEEVK